MADDKFKIPKSLVDALKAGNVVPFVGAGVSMSVKKKNADDTKSDESLFPSWKGFIETLVQSLRDELKNEVAEFILLGIKTGKLSYLDALQEIQKDLGNRLWYKLFEENFDKSQSEADEDSFKLYKLIWELGKNLIITTNVDRVFQWTCSQPTEFRILDVQNAEYAQLQSERIPKRPTVWYLHGHIDHKEKVIFTREQFESFYKARNNEAKLQTLLSFLTQRTFLFIGFSLDDAYLREQLEYIHKIYKGGADSFYILLRERDIPAANLPEYVKPVPFSDFGKPLEDLIAELVRIAESSNNSGDGNTNNGKTISPTDSKIKAEKSFFNVPYNSKGAEFVGRVGKVEEIWNLLSQGVCAQIGQAVSVKGLGGFGKTQLAVEYAHAYRDKYPNGVFWVVADQNIDNQLLQIAEEQGWINKDDKSVNQFDVAKAKFLELSDCLILFDNVETYDGIKDYLPKTDSRTHLLITSREKLDQFKAIDLDLLERSESRELLLKISKRDPQDEVEKEHLEKILDILGDIPLAVELVGGYLAEHEIISFAQYHQYLDEVPLDRLEKEFPDGSFTKHDRSIIQTLRISEKIINEKPLMVEILKVLAWSGSSAMGISLLKALVENEDDSTEAEKEFEFNNALAEAHKLRLLKKDKNEERYTIHRLIAKVTRYEIPLENQKEWILKIVRKLEHWFEPKIYEFSDLAEFESEIEHLQEWQNNISKNYPKEAILLTALRANPLHYRGNFQQARYWIENAFDLYRKQNCKDEKLLAILELFMGVNCSALGNHQKGLEHYKISLEIWRELFGENNSQFARILSNIGSAYIELGIYQKALNLHQKSLNIRKELHGEAHPTIAHSLHGIGSAYNNLGKYEKALEFKQQALEMQREIFGEIHPSIASSLSSLSHTYQLLNKPEKALNLSQKSVEINKAFFGETHPQVADSLHNLAFAYGMLKKHEKELKLNKEVLEINKRLYGQSHPHIASSLNNIGHTYGNLNNYKEKLTYHNAALEMQYELFGRKHPDIIASLNNIGNAYGHLKNTENELEYYEAALEMANEVLGNYHPNTILICKNLVIALGNAGKLEQKGRLAAKFLSYVPHNNPERAFFEKHGAVYQKVNQKKKKNRRR